MAKVYEFKAKKDIYLNLADKKAEKGDFIGALSMLFRALDAPDFQPEIYGDIADIYADMELYELSNKYWFKYLGAVSKEMTGTAYEELGINYFCLQNYFVSGYYFHKKVCTDGFISEDGPTEEMMEMFSETFNNKKAYRIVYPFDKADYSFEINNAKRALVNGDYAQAIRLYSEVPKGCRQYGEASKELAIVRFLTGEVDKAIELTKSSIEEEGETTALLCNLSSMYKQKKDDDKSAYYYNRAKEIYDGDKEGMYKLSTNALEQGDTETAIIYLKQVTEERPYEINLNFLYSLALANQGEYKKALSVMRKLCILKPQDTVYLYYLSLFSELIDGKNHDDIMPFEYIDDLPKAERIKRTRRIDQIFSLDISKLPQKLKDQKIIELLSWGIEHGNERTIKKCVYILTQTDSLKAVKLLKEKLIDPEVSDEVKRAIIFMLVLSGQIKKIPAVVKDFYMTIRPRELPCKKSSDGAVFYAGYALCLSRIIFGEANEFDKVAFATDRVYKRLAHVIGDEYDKETLAALIVSESKLEKLPSEADVCALFGTTVEKLKTLKTIYSGEKND